MRINLFFLNPVSFGGHVSFTVHLMKGMKSNGIDVRLYKVGKTTQSKPKDFGYGQQYVHLSVEDAIKLVAEEDPCLITAPSKPKSELIDSLLEVGARIVIHDPAEFKHGWDWKSVERPLIIRESMIQYFDDAVFLKHPYHPLMSSIRPSGEWTAVSTSRIDFDKHTEILLDANRLIPDEHKIHIYGFENRIYTRFKIVPNYPEWVQSQAKYPKDDYYAVKNFHAKSEFTCDMSVIKGDGGGTQYTFLEAFDGGSCLVLNSEWVIDGHVMQPDRNCLAVSDGNELAELINRYVDGDESLIKKVDLCRKRARQLMKQHDATTISNLWADELLQ